MNNQISDEYPQNWAVHTCNYGLGNWTALLVCSPATCLLPVTVHVTSESYMDRLDNADCHASASPAVLTDTER